MSGAAPQLIAYLGTFDPPHLGHAHCLTQAIAKFPQAEILVLPSYAPAGADGQHKEPATPYEHRTAMVQTMLADLKLPVSEAKRVEVSTLEQDLPAPNYTATTLAHVRQSRPERLAVLMGSDQFAAFDRWHTPKTILELADVVVVLRDAENQSFEAMVTTVLERLGLEFKLTADGHLQLAGGLGRIWLINEAPHPAASSLIRNAMQGSPTATKQWLSPGVIKYIDANNLYKDA